MTSSKTDLTWEQGLCFIILYIPCSFLKMFAEGIRSNHWINIKYIFCIGPSRKVSQRRQDTGHFPRQWPESTFQQEQKDKVGIQCRPQCGVDYPPPSAPDRRSPEGCREELCFIPQVSRRHSSVFSQGSNKILALLWEDYLGSYVKDGLGETRDRVITWVSLQ